jgi:hypothetical protein
MNFQALEKTLSSPRLEAYRLLASDSNQLLLDRYAWNMALSESLYTPVSIFEVAFRNQIHHAATAKWGANWIFDPQLILDPMKIKVHEATNELERVGKDPTPERVVAALSFGTWTAFFGHGYDKHFISHLLAPCFPNLIPTNRTRKKLASVVHAVRNFRNRLFHHEPIWKYHDLHEHYSRITDAVGWMCSDTRSWLLLHDRFPEIYRSFLASEVYFCAPFPIPSFLKVPLKQ